MPRHAYYGFCYSPVRPTCLMEYAFNFILHYSRKFPAVRIYTRLATSSSEWYATDRQTDGRTDIYTPALTSYVPPYEANFKNIVIPRPAYGALSVTALVGLMALTFDLLTCK